MYSIHIQRAENISGSIIPKTKVQNHQWVRKLFPASVTAWYFNFLSINHKTCFMNNDCKSLWTTGEVKDTCACGKCTFQTFFIGVSWKWQNITVVFVKILYQVTKHLRLFSWNNFTLCVHLGCKKNLHKTTKSEKCHHRLTLQKTGSWQFIRWRINLTCPWPYKTTQTEKVISFKKFN